jgi:hypothetical protein
MKVLFIQHARVMGGSVVSLRQILLQMSKKNKIDYAVVVPTDFIGAQYADITPNIYTLKTATSDYYSGSNISLRSLRFAFKTIKTLIATIFSTPRLLYIVYKTRPDIVHLNSMMLFLYLIPLKLTRAKVLIHIREQRPKNPLRFFDLILRYVIKKFSDHIVYISAAEKMSLQLEGSVVPNFFASSSNEVNRHATKLQTFTVLSDIVELKCSKQILTSFVKSQVKGDLKFVGGRDSYTNPQNAYQKDFKETSNIYKKKDGSVEFLPFSFDISQTLKKSDFLIFWITSPHFPRPAYEALLFGCIPILSRSAYEASSIPLEYVLVGEDNSEDSLLRILDSDLETAKKNFPFKEAQLFAEKSFGAQNFNLLLSVYDSLNSSNRR